MTDRRGGALGLPAAPAELLAAIVENADDAILSKTLDGTVTSWNAAAERMYGYTAAEMIGQPVARLAPPERPDEIPSIMARLARGERIERYLTERVRRDGHRIRVALTISPLRAPDGRIVGASTIARDVTAQLASELALRASEERFRGLLDSDPNAVLMVDVEGRIVYANTLTGQLFRYEPEALLGLPVERLVPKAFRRAHARHRAAYEADPATRQMGFGRELAGLRADGSEFPAEIGLSSFVAGAERYVTVVVADISRRKAAERELVTANETLRSLVDSSPLPILLLDLDGTVRLWNLAAERVFGWSAREMVGGRPLLVPEASRQEAAELFDRLAAGGVIAGRELELLRRDGGRIEVELYAAPRRDAEGRVSGAVAQLIDVTARRQLEEQLLQAQKMESIGRLAGGVAHDFNNMLTAISGFAQLLLLDLPEGTEQHESARAIKRAAAQAAALTQQLLAFSRRQVLQPRVLDPNEAIVGMEPMLRRLIGEDVELRVIVRPAAGRLRADPAQLEQVILNLVVNARDAMPSGGVLTIETAPAQFDEAYAAEHFDVSPGRYVLLAVSDTGVGMDRATRAHVFEPFFTTKERGKGTGLGLATIYGIVRQSDGHIWLYSEPGHGTTFKIYFPRIAEEADEAPAPPPQAVGGTETILLVEDEDGVRELARIVLERQGYEVLAAADATGALELAAAHSGRIQLLVTDVVMPGLSGPELAARLRALRPEATVLFLSGYTEEVAGRGVHLAEGGGFLAKPFTPEALARKVREVLGATQRRG
ncbi:MAG TPA: PAS domain S-box protein [Candidatus Limnocylindrales bacterium]